jgi:hypothetical protein
MSRLAKVNNSKSHKYVVKARPYGDTEIVKEECVNHIGKRLGTSLRKRTKNNDLVGKRKVH